MQKQSNRELLKKFDNLLIQHPRFMSVFEELSTHMQFGPSGRILMVVGPTGVGKTTLLRFFDQQLIHLLKTHTMDFSPPLVCEAVAPELGEFSWKDFYTRALIQLNEPALEKKNNLDEVAERVRSGERLTWFRRMTIPDLRRQFEIAVREHRPIATLMDEAQHMGKSRSAVRRLDNLDVIKSHANVTATTMVLFGTYELKELLYVGAQLSRRIEVIHFPRYRTTEEDLSQFARTVASFQKALPLRLARDVRRDVEYYLRYSAGCSGILHSWFRKALERAMKANSGVLKQCHLDAARLTSGQLAAIANEIAEFELFFESHDLPKIWRDLGIAAEATSPTSSAPENFKKKGGRTGQRKAVRDPVGAD